MCRIHKSNGVLDVSANPYIFKNFGHVPPPKTEKKDEQNFQKEMVQQKATMLKNAAAEAKKIVDSAQEQADKMIKKAGQEAGKLMNQAVLDGYQKGLMSAEGKVAEFMEEMNRQAQDFMARSKQESDAVFSELEQNALDISLEIAEKILHTELNRNDSALLSVVSQSLQGIKAQTEATVLMQPEEFKKLSGLEEFRSIKEQSGGKIQFMADSNRQKGDILIQTDGEIIDAGVNSQFSTIKSALLKQL